MPLPEAAEPTTGPLERRRAGVLLHVTSLPSELGTGDLGPGAHAFVDFLADAGCTVWQVLPLVPTHLADRSPYNAVSALAGNPDLISLDALAADGLLPAHIVADVRGGLMSRSEALVLAGRTFLAQPDNRGELDRFRDEERSWLDDYVAFVALRESLGFDSWDRWPEGLRDRDPEAMREALAPLTGRVDLLCFEQWAFARQWSALREHAASRGVLLFGDLPIFVSYDSADVWSSRASFLLDEVGHPTTVTGVPPDYFSADGQRWDNPHYDWAQMARDDFAWWRERVRLQRRLFDLVRIDHFRGFEAAWHVPVEAPTAKTGHWVTNPGAEVLTALVDTSGEGTLVAEDLGTITPEVEALRRRFGLPGMKILQFAFDGDPHNWYLPANHEELSVVYTGTHDNDTTLGWWEKAPPEVRARVEAELPEGSEEMPWALVRLAYASVARLAVVPAQDLLELGTDCRMNIPGVGTGNWTWQAEPGAFDDALAARLREVVEATDRLAEPVDG